MAVPQFSESQFVIGYLREYLSRQPFFPNFFWFFNSIEVPSTVEEVETGADFIFRYYSHSEFLQFKRSHFLSWRGKGYLNEPEKNLPKSFFGYYRFKVYNSPDSRQFEKLKEVSTINPNDKSYYVAPLFHTRSEFNELFAMQNIVQNSVRIDCAQFNSPLFLPPHFDVRQDDSHRIIYNEAGEGYMFSEPKQIEIIKGIPEAQESTQNSVEADNTIKAIVELNRIAEFCRRDEAGNRYYSNAPQNTFEFIYNHFLINYDLHWVPIINLRSYE